MARHGGPLSIFARAVLPSLDGQCLPHSLFARAITRELTQKGDSLVQVLDDAPVMTGAEMNRRFARHLRTARNRISLVEVPNRSESFPKNLIKILDGTAT